MSNYDDISTPIASSRYDEISMPVERRKKPIAPIPEVDYENMPFYEKMGRGAVGDVMSMYRGGKELLGQETPEDIAESEKWKQESEKLGGWGTVGGILGQGVATLPLTLATGGAGTALAHLPKVGKAIQALGQVGGRYLNLGRATAAGTEAALAAGIAKPEEGDTRLGNMAKAGTIGAALPTALTTAAAPVKAIARATIPTTRNAQSRAINAFEKTLGGDEMSRVEQTLRARAANPEEAARIPQTTAAATDSARLGELEAGARVRNTQGFGEHDRQVAMQAFDRINAESSNVFSPEYYAGKVEKVQQAGVNLLDRYKASNQNKSLLQDKVLQVLDSSSVRNTPELENKFMNILAKLEDDVVTAADIRVIRDQLKASANIPGVPKLINDFTNIGDEASQGAFTKVEAALDKTRQKAEAAEAQRAVRRKFRTDEGVALGGGIYKRGDEQIPNVTGGRLRSAVAGQEGRLSPEAHADMMGLTELLRKHELHKPVADVRGSSLDTESLRGPVGRGLSATPLWKLRAPFEFVSGKANAKAEMVADEAMRHPDKFLALIDAKKLRGQPLTKTERAIADMLINAPMRSVGASQGE